MNRCGARPCRWTFHSHDAGNRIANARGEILNATFGNQDVRSLGYDARGRVTSISDVNTGNDQVYSVGLTYAGNSNPLTANDSVNGNWTYTYDDFNRIATGAASNTGQACIWAYDRYGNRWQQSQNGGNCLTVGLSFNSNNHMVGSGYSYDAAGNLLSDNVNTYTYDAENRISSADAGSITYVYDAFGHRVRKTVSFTSQDFTYDLQGHVLDTLQPAILRRWRSPQPNPASRRHQGRRRSSASASSRSARAANAAMAFPALSASRSARSRSAARSAVSRVSRSSAAVS